MLEVAGGSPRADALAKLGPAPFPFRPGGVRAFASSTRVALQLPLAAGEEIWGLGLDFKKVRRNGTISTLRVDHWGGRSGRTHAPVPFYVSSRGYGVLVDSARYLGFYAGMIPFHT